MIIVPTIPCTGTHFLLDLLGIKPQGMLWNWHQDGVMYGHIYPEYKDIFLPLCDWNTTLVPLRHPFVVAKSWAQRGGCMIQMVEMWDLLVKEIDPMGPQYLPIDSPNRDYYMIAAATTAGIEPSFEWAPVESKNNNHSFRYHDIETQWTLLGAGGELVLDLVDRISGFLSRFY